MSLQQTSNWKRVGSLLLKGVNLFSLPLILCMLALPPMAQATTWDLQNDFSSLSNPNGVWAFGYELTLGGSFTAYDSIRNGNQWYSSAHHSGDFTPTVWLNTGSSTSYGIAPGEVSLHPGWDGSFTVVQWISPFSGLIDVNGAFGAGDIGAMSNYMLQNGSAIVSDPNDGGSLPFSFSGLTVASGDVISFLVGVGQYGYGYGNTELSVTITGSGSGPTGPTVPEPCTFVLLGSALAGLAAYRRLG